MRGEGRRELPLDVAVLVGCGVPTGRGTAVNTGGVRPGDTVVIYGIGGFGINSVQGAAYAAAKTELWTRFLVDGRNICGVIMLEH